MNSTDKFDHIYIDEASAGSNLARRLEAWAPGKISYRRERPWREGAMSPTEFDRSKKNLWVTPHRGQFFKRCPGAKPGLTCCNYFVLNLGAQCDMNCSYCYLQSFLNAPILTVFSNLDDAIGELAALHKQAGSAGLRVGTGEVVDSLSLDDITLASRDLIAFFRTAPAWTLEFKTKSNRVAQFLDCEHAGNVVVSWSINPPAIVAAEEHGTASWAERKAAALQCAAKGFPLAFHMDPMIWHPDWQMTYGALVDDITAAFSPQQVRTLSLGALRFQPQQRAMMRERFGARSLVNQAEMFTGRDGKMRYAQELRSEMFDFVLKRFRNHSREWRVFLCMETPETWLDTFEQPAHHVASLKPLFDPRVARAAQAPRRLE